MFSLRLADNRMVSLAKPSVMGVINMSPDSFYRPYRTQDEILSTVEAMVTGGADIIDVGGEATNLTIDLARSPGVQEQIDRVVPLIERIARQFPVLISVDTSQPAVMREAVAHGAHIINDQRGLQAPEALAAAVELAVPVCLMHFFTSPRQPGASDFPALLAEIKADLAATVARCLNAGMLADRILIDPGFGQGHYGKNTQENYYLLAHLTDFTALGFPVLAGWSRKSMIGETLGGIPAHQRLYGSIAAATLAAQRGAAVIRAHDVAETVDAMKVFREFQAYEDRQWQ